MKVLAGANRLGPVAVFLPDGSHAEVSGHPDLTEPLLAEVAARGAEATFGQHAEALRAGPGYAGRWSLPEVPDGITAAQALHLIRYRAAQDLFHS
jgi:hypothetical protein